MQSMGALVLYALSHAQPGSEFGLALMLSLSAIFFGLWVWGKRAPFAALLTALIVWVTFQLVGAVIEPESLFRGIIIKGAVLVGICTALKKAYVAKREQELAKLA
jgi:hypothetical protein